MNIKFLRKRKIRKIGHVAHTPVKILIKKVFPLNDSDHFFKHETDEVLEQFCSSCFQERRMPITKMQTPLWWTVHSCEEIC